ncbi:cytochrome P450 [Aspergillus ibericus CBS 121593]|uniref:Cytochrome P450 n=1 Tax=Aspergillus ibericus CBS 121593 TaxID=1448316 RepID=A0A395GMG7_9EURO|nr:cytochrome P450 [Aspergillus ibericus CBS 121593]RAK96669.1 cytochrome P450 [Aspergillus ibericus CBS 121593]
MTALRLLVGLLIVLLVSYLIYQVWLHPLASYPGPFVAKLTDLYSVVHAIRGDRHEDLYRLHQCYGGIVRIGPQRLSVLDAKALESIYGFQANVQKSQWYRTFYGTSIFNTIDRRVHSRKRRVMSQAFSNQALRGMEPHILSAIQVWCAVLGDQHPDKPVRVASSDPGAWSRPKDMVHWSSCVIFDALGEICFGKTFNTSLSDANHFFFPLMALNVRITNICGQMPILRRLGVDKYLRSGTVADRKRQIDFSQQLLRTRLAAEPTERRDIIYYLRQARDPETKQGYSETELMSEVVMLLGAGNDTTNAALTATFYFLAHHPTILARLSAEIRAVFAAADAIVAGPQLAQLAYLRACIEESMRLCPPVPADLPREVLPGGLQVGTWHFPAGTVIGVPTYALHHSQEHFDRPFMYDPSRWLLYGSEGTRDGEGVSAEVLSRQRQAFVPFSLGPRGCIGRSVAMLELEVSIARVLWLYDLRLAPGTERLGVGPEGEYKIEDNFIIGKEGPVLQFRTRQT